MSTNWSQSLPTILLAFSILSAPVNSYNCKQLDPNNSGNRRCPEYHGGPAIPPQKCLVTKLSVSAFIQCSFSSDSSNAKDPDAPRFTIISASGSDSVGPLDLLTQTLLTRPDCQVCPLASRLRDAAEKYGDGIGKGPFARYFCKFSPTDAGMCCLKKCVQSLSREHSIEAFCKSGATDLINVRPLPESCVDDRKDTSTSDGSTSGTGTSDSTTYQDDSGYRQEQG